MIVVLIIADSLKATAPGFAPGPAHTPYMDQLAKNGVVFDQMFASGAWTVPSIMSMLTGTLGHKIGVCRWRHPFPAKRPTLLSAFAAAGFEVSVFHPYPHWGFLTVTGKGKMGNSQDPNAIINALKKNPNQDKLVVIHHWWTHLPYINKVIPRDKWHQACDLSVESLNKHPTQFAQILETKYLNSVSFLSEKLLPQYMDAATSGGQDVLLALTGDHGETWGDSLPPAQRVETVYDLHGKWFTDETLRIPLLIHGKCRKNSTTASIPGNKRIAGFTAGTDITPTLTELAGVPWPGPTPQISSAAVVERNTTALDIEGKSLAPAIFTDAPTGRTEVVTLSSHNTLAPKTYPACGSDMWRTFALRNSQGWHIWDGVTQKRTIVSPIGEYLNHGNAANTDDSLFQRLESYRLSAVDSAPIVPEAHLSSLREAPSENGASQDSKKVEQRLANLGYLD